MGKEESIQQSCPIQQMSFGDVSRYLQGGFDSAVQRAVAAHVVYCNSCREELERMKALRTAGRHVMVSQLTDVERENNDGDEQGGGHVEEAVLAAYIDNGLTTDHRIRVTEHIASCHPCYLQFSALEKELDSPVPRPLRAPADLVAAMKRPVPVAAPQLNLADIGRRIVDTVETMLGLRWTQPALAFAMGVLVMLMFLPSSRTVIPLPGVSPIQTSFDDKIRSSVDESEPTIDTRPVIMIPAEAGGKLEFTWPGDKLADGIYRVEIFDENGNQVLDSQEVSENKWVADVSVFKSGSRYDILVSRIGRAGGVQPVSQQSLLVAD